MDRHYLFQAPDFLLRTLAWSDESKAIVIPFNPPDVFSQRIADWGSGDLVGVPASDGYEDSPAGFHNGYAVLAAG